MCKVLVERVIRKRVTTTEVNEIRKNVVGRNGVAPLSALLIDAIRQEVERTYQLWVTTATEAQKK